MKLFDDMKISKKLLAGFVTVALISGIAGVLGSVNISRISGSDTELYEKNTIAIQYAGLVAGDFQKVRASVGELVLRPGEANWQKNSNDINNTLQEIGSTLNKYEGIVESQEEINLIGDLKADMTLYSTVVEKVVTLMKEEKTEEAKTTMYSDSVSAITSKIGEGLGNMLGKELNSAEKKAHANAETANTTTMAMIVISLVSFGISIGLGFYISGDISRPINKLVKVVETVADGDLNVNIDINTKDEIGILAAAVARMTDNLNQVMSNIEEAAAQVASGSRQMSDSSMALSQGATEQASSIEELTASLEEISSQTRLNANSANEANTIAEAAKANAVKGNNQMIEMLKAMDEINESSGNIYKIIKVIDEIAFQTNILALNAAVEAARAGQHGKGFAVVAEEVRNLAARSADAAKETTDMIEGSIKKVEGGTHIANETAGALNQIVEGVKKVSNLIGNIAIASNEQASGIAQINQGISQVSQVVQTNSATSEESAAASQELASQAELLIQQVSRFKLKKMTHLSSRFDDIDPDVLRMIEQMNEKKKLGIKGNGSKNVKSESNSGRRSSFGNDFGKY